MILQRLDFAPTAVTLALTLLATTTMTPACGPEPGEAPELPAHPIDIDAPSSEPAAMNQLPTSSEGLQFLSFASITTADDVGPHEYFASPDLRRQFLDDPRLSADECYLEDERGFTRITCPSALELAADQEWWSTGQDIHWLFDSTLEVSDPDAARHPECGGPYCIPTAACDWRPRRYDAVLIMGICFWGFYDCC